ncbi:TetR/AcrR family transcriptional regulator [Streptomyces sp. NPDC048606]|uniref:TetR/AcrR family transcriptional regulator n=1 Tax=Streptomyces sp. NPDC048606 TaxID=3154726 RepID=UPI00342DDC0F
MSSAEPPPSAPVPSVWTGRRRRGERPALSREQIVAAAVRLLDAEGLEALSMRRLGTGMGTAATSLYRHVANKDELIELVVDAVHVEVDLPSEGGPEGWREALSRGAHSLRSMVLRHPWVASVPGRVGLAHPGPNQARMSERMLAPARDVGFPPGEAELAVRAVVSYVIGATTGEASRLSPLARGGTSGDGRSPSPPPADGESLEGHPPAKDHAAGRQGVDPARTRAEDFDYGLQRMLDGLATRVNRG